MWHARGAGCRSLPQVLRFTRLPILAREADNDLMSPRRLLICRLAIGPATVFALILLGVALIPAAPSCTVAQAQQTLAQRTSAKVIDTPDPNVKWRINDGKFVERSVDAGASWHGQELDPQGVLLAGSAPNAKTCWVVGRNGLVFVTKDAKKWKQVRAPASVDLVAVSAKNARSAIVTTADGRQFETHNGGKKWKPVSGSRK